MSFFSRRDDTRPHSHHHSHRHHREKHSSPENMNAPAVVPTTNGHNGGTAFVNQRPTFGTWFKMIWLDILTMVILGAVGLGVYMAPPAPSRNFPVLFQDGEVVYPQFAYPLRKNIIPIWLAAFLASIIPITIFLLAQIKIRSFWDLNNAVLGLLYSLINAAVFQVFIKWLIGGLRPHFLDVCKPDPAKLSAMLAGMSGAGGRGFQGIMFDRSICTGDRKEINDSLESMPSGHSTAAFAGFVFLFLWLNAKMKLWGSRHQSMWKMTIVYAPLLGAVLIAGSLTIDEFHHWYDVCAGATIGTAFAFGGYRMVYAAIWDWRFNHIPLVRGSSGGEDDNGVYGYEHRHGHGHGERRRSRSAHRRAMRGADNV